MKTVALISGGKDSILSVLLAMRYGHTPVVVANICPTCSERNRDVHEIDSYSFQTVGHEVVESIAFCMGLPLRRAYIFAGQSKVRELHYTKDSEDEVEVLYQLLDCVKKEFPEVEGVTTGAILSHYQRYRVEDVCNRLGLCSLAFLWQRPADEILDMAATLHVSAVLVKTASIGLDPRIHLGMLLEEVRPVLEKAQRLYGVHGAGEGGEFETIVLDCPLFKSQRLEIVGMERVIVDDNDYAPSGHARLKVVLRDKTYEEKAATESLLRELPTLVFSSDRMQYLPRRADDLARVLMESAVVPVEAHVPCEGDAHFWGVNGLCDIYYSAVLQGEDELENCLTSLFQRIVKDVSKKEHEIFFLFVFSPCMAYFKTFCEIFALFFPLAQPPPPGLTFVEFCEEHSFRVEALSARQSFIDRSALYVWSRSCWGAYPSGPHSLSNRVNIFAERRVVVSGCIGLVPADRRLACVEDMPELQVVSLLCQSQMFGIGETAMRSFVVQFAFAYANSFNGLLHFCDGGGATHATFLLKDVRFAPLLVPLWRWCSGGTQSLVPWKQLRGFLATGEVCFRVIRVTQLSFNADVELILERRVICDNEELTNC